MKKLLSAVAFCASLIAAPLAAHATTITGTLGVTLNFPTGYPTLTGANSVDWTSGQTSAGTPGSGDFSSVLGGLPLNGDSIIYLGAGKLGGPSSSNPFDFSILNVGTFVATTDVTKYFLGPTGANSSSGVFSISGYFTPTGTLALAGYTVTSADVNFALSQSGIGGGSTATGSFTLSTPSTFNPPPPPTVPEPSSLALLGTGLLGGVGMVRRRFKA